MFYLIAGVFHHVSEHSKNVHIASIFPSRQKRLQRFVPGASYEGFHVKSISSLLTPVPSLLRLDQPRNLDMTFGNTFRATVAAKVS